jgi:hypothetical protein
MRTCETFTLLHFSVIKFFFVGPPQVEWVKKPRRVVRYVCVHTVCILYAYPQTRGLVRYVSLGLSAILPRQKI